MALLMTICLAPHSGQAQDAAGLVEQFQAENIFWRQFTIAKEIVRLQDRRALGDLASWLDHEDRHIRGNTAFIFAALGDDGGLRVISAILTDGSDRRLGQGIGIAPGNPATPGWWLAPQLRADRYYAIHLLGELRDPRSVPILIPLLHDELNYKVAWALGEIGDTRAVGPLIETLSDTDPSVRVIAVGSLEKLGAKEVLPALRVLLDDHARANFGEQMSVDDAARRAIATLEMKP